MALRLTETNKVRKIENVHTTNFFYILRKGIHKVGEFPKKIVMKELAFFVALLLKNLSLVFICYNS